MTQKMKVSVSKKKNDRTSVPNIFLDQYMRDANGDFVKVYLYLLRCTNEEDPAASVCEIADLLNLTEKDIVRALKYWVKVSALKVEWDKESGEPTSIVFLPLKDQNAETQTAAQTVVAGTEASAEAEAGSEAGKVMKPVRNTESSRSAESAISTKPVRSDGYANSAASVRNAGSVDSAMSAGNTESVSGGYAAAGAKSSVSRNRAARAKEQDEVSQMFFIVENYIGRPLNSTETNTILYFYDSLRFSSELIEYLVEYCVNNNHKSLHYMESVAVAWANQGVTSVEDAKEISRVRNSNVSCVMKTFGIQDRSITSVEMDFITRWYAEYGFGQDLITEACRRTILSVGKANFSYAEKILKEWHNAGVKTMEDVKLQDSRYRSSKNTTNGNAAPKAASNNRFNNFSSRTYNFDELEKELLSSSGNNQ